MTRQNGYETAKVASCLSLVGAMYAELGDYDQANTDHLLQILAEIPKKGGRYGWNNQIPKKGGCYGWNS